MEGKGIVIFIKKSGCPLRATTIVQKNILICSRQTAIKFSVRLLTQEQTICSALQRL